MADQDESAALMSSEDKRDYTTKDQPDWSRFGLSSEQRRQAEVDKHGDGVDVEQYTDHGNFPKNENELFTEDENLHRKPWWQSNFFISEPVLFGAWDGVFTSCMINIFGVVIFLRTGWMVGNAGIGLSVVIILLTIMVAMTAALASIGVCERCTIGAGGVYFLLSHVLGARMGASVGILYCLGQAIACSLYTIGFGESIATLINGDDPNPWIARGIATGVLCLLLCINVAGVKWVIRLQLILLLILFVGVLDFFVGSFVHIDPADGVVGYSTVMLANNTAPSYLEGQSFFTVFGVFFPTATGVFAGINMSGDLHNPTKNVPQGTLSAVGVSTFLYLTIALVLAATCTRDALQTDYLVASKVTVDGVLWLAGLYVSSVSSCMGALYGSPRIIQSIANEKVIPIMNILGRGVSVVPALWLLALYVASLAAALGSDLGSPRILQAMAETGDVPIIRPLAKGRGPNKVPVYALVVVTLVALLFIFIGQVNTLGPIVTMPFMLTYAAVDYAYFVLAMSFDKQKAIDAKYGKLSANSDAKKLQNGGSQLSYGATQDSLKESLIKSYDDKSDLDNLFPERNGHHGFIPPAQPSIPPSPVEEKQVHFENEMSLDEDKEKLVEQTSEKKKPVNPEIIRMPRSWYSFLCNRWLSMLGAIVCLVIMFAIQWLYALITVVLAVVIYFYIGKVNPGVFPDPQLQVSRRRRSPFPGNVSGAVWDAWCDQSAIHYESETDFDASRKSCGEGQNLLPQTKETKMDAKPILSRQELKCSLSLNKKLFKSLVMEKVSNTELEAWLEKKRLIEKATEDRPVVYTYPEGPNRFTDYLAQYLNREASNEGLAGYNEGYIHEKLYIELGKAALNAVQADGAIVYLVNPGQCAISRRVFSWRNGLTQSISYSKLEISPVSVHVSKTRSGILVPELARDKRFNKFSALNDDCSLICLPMMGAKNELVGVLELSRGLQRPPFNERHYQVANAFMAWSCLGINQALKNEANKRKKNLCSFLLENTTDMFEDVTQYHSIMGKIMTHTKALVGAERCIIVLYDTVKEELYVELVDTGEVDESGKPIYQKTKKPYRYPVNKNCCLMSACGRVINNARVSVFNELDESLHSCYSELQKLCNTKIRNMVCMPIMNNDSVFGAFEVINKLGNTPFRNADIEVLSMFSKYFSLALKYSKVYSEMEEKESCADIAIEQLQYQALTQESGILSDLVIKMKPDIKIPDDFESHLFVITDDIANNLPNLFVYMVHQLFGDTINEVKLCSFTETVHRNYRIVPYHNWEHAFLVTHCMYLILKDLRNVLTDFEGMALLFACICHDLDHRGYNNKFFETLHLPLAALYSTSVMEQHHFQTTVLILQQEANCIFDHFTESQYKEMLELIRHAIISTDLGLFFGNNKPLMEGILADGSFNINEQEHRDVTKAVMMTASDLCGATKPWPQQVKNVKLIYDEFYVQGDIERERGYTPIAMMDRENKEKMADQQTGFMKYVCIPLYDTLGKVVPLVQEMKKTVEQNTECWQKVGFGEFVPPWEASIAETIGIADFSLFQWLRECCRRGPAPPEEIVISPNTPAMNTMAAQLTEDNDDFKQRGRYHQSEVVHGDNFDDYNDE